MKKKIRPGLSGAADLHKNVPPNWYYQSTRPNLSWYWPLQKYWHDRRFHEVGKLIEKTNGQILDIGSADGVFTEFILQKTQASKIIGIEALVSSVRWARKHWPDKRLDFLVGDAHTLPFPDKSFDAVFALEVLEHVSDPGKVLKEIRRVLKDNGYAVFLVPSDNLLFRVLWDNFWTKTRGKVWNDTHIQTYRKNYLVKISKESGFNVTVSIKFILGMLHLVKVRKS